MRIFFSSECIVGVVKNININFINPIIPKKKKIELIKNTVDELGINLDNLTLVTPSIEKPDLTEKRLSNYAFLIRI